MLNIEKYPSALGAEVSGLTLAGLDDQDILATLRAAMDEHAVLVFRNQPLTTDQQLAFAQNFDGALHTKTSTAALGNNRFGNAALTDISNTAADGEILAADDRRRMNSIANRLWHTDASFQSPPGRYSLLSAQTIPPVRADTEFADMRAAYDALSAEEKALVDGLTVFHSIAYSREVMGFAFLEGEKETLKGAVHPLVRVLPRTGRKSLYLASHAEKILEMPVPEGRLLLRDLIEHATQPCFVHRHEWRVDDLVIWDNRTTMHRARPFDDKTHRRELRRTTTLDLPMPA
jgi:alpha-ketoglutarate-dependent 2,4-dichlorophenoxyacetate dioxygenase